eukprot:g2338.t1
MFYERKSSMLDKGNTAEIMDIISVVMYSLFLCLELSRLFIHIRASGVRAHRTVFHFFATCFFAFQLSDFCFLLKSERKEGKSTNSDFFMPFTMNVFAICCYTSALTLMILHWALVLMPPSSSMQRCLIICFWISTVLVVCGGAYFVMWSKDYDNVCKDVGSFKTILSVWCALLTIIFLVIGWRIYVSYLNVWKIKSRQARETPHGSPVIGQNGNNAIIGDDSAEVARTLREEERSKRWLWSLWRLLAAMAVCVLCDVCHVFVQFPTFGICSNYSRHIIFNYWIPEIVPFTLLVLLMWSPLSAEPEELPIHHSLENLRHGLLSHQDSERWQGVYSEDPNHVRSNGDGIAAAIERYRFGGSFYGSGSFYGKTISVDDKSEAENMDSQMYEESTERKDQFGDFATVDVSDDSDDSVDYDQYVSAHRRGSNSLSVTPLTSKNTFDFNENVSLRYRKLSTNTPTSHTSRKTNKKPPKSPNLNGQKKIIAKRVSPKMQHRHTQIKKGSSRRRSKLAPPLEYAPIPPALTKVGSMPVVPRTPDEPSARFQQCCISLECSPLHFRFGFHAKKGSSATESALERARKLNDATGLHAKSRGLIPYEKESRKSSDKEKSGEDNVVRENVLLEKREMSDSGQLAMPLLQKLRSSSDGNFGDMDSITAEENAGYLVALHQRRSKGDDWQYKTMTDVREIGQAPYSSSVFYSKPHIAQHAVGVQKSKLNYINGVNDGDKSPRRSLSSPKRLRNFDRLPPGFKFAQGSKSGTSLNSSNESVLREMFRGGKPFRVVLPINPRDGTQLRFDLYRVSSLAVFSKEDLDDCELVGSVEASLNEILPSANDENLKEKKSSKNWKCSEDVLVLPMIGKDDSSTEGCVGFLCARVVATIIATRDARRERRLFSFAMNKIASDKKSKIPNNTIHIETQLSTGSDAFSHESSILWHDNTTRSCAGRRQLIVEDLYECAYSTEIPLQLLPFFIEDLKRACEDATSQLKEFEKTHPELRLRLSSSPDAVGSTDAFPKTVDALWKGLPQSDPHDVGFLRSNHHSEKKTQDRRHEKNKEETSPPKSKPGWYESLAGALQSEAEFLKQQEWLQRRVRLRRQRLKFAQQCLSACSIWNTRNQTFKSSRLKKQREFSFMPTNLHLQRMMVFETTNPTLKNTANEKEWVTDRSLLCLARDVYDTITVGAATAIPDGFRHGGISHLRQVQDKLREEIALLEAKFKFTGGSAARNSRSKTKNEATLLDITRELDEVTWEIEMRTQVVTSQFAAALVSAFCARVDSAIRRLYAAKKNENLSAKVKDDMSFLSQLEHVGMLLQVEDLLSTHGKEAGMLEDYVAAVKAMRCFAFRLHVLPNVEKEEDAFVNKTIGVVKVSVHRCTKSEKSQRLNGRKRIEKRSGGHFVVAVGVRLGMKDRAEDFIPHALLEGMPIPVTAVIFTQGINEMQTFANTVEKGKAEMQGRINAESFATLARYCKKYMHWRDSPVSSVDVGKTLDAIRETLATSELERKNVELLQLTADLTRRISGVRVTSCKSAKDRTAMSVTLEQARLLQQEHGLYAKRQSDCDDEFDAKESHELLADATDVMRSHGVRRANALKNTGRAQFCFNRLQRSFLPADYIPPPGTGGGRFS